MIADSNLFIYVTFDIVLFFISDRIKYNNLNYNSFLKLNVLSKEKWFWTHEN